MKKKLSFLLVIAFLIPVLTSCKPAIDSGGIQSPLDSENQTAASIELRPTETFIPTDVWRGEFFSFPDNLYVNRWYNFVSGGKVYILIEDKAYADTPDGRRDRFGFCILSPEDGVLETVLVPPGIPLSDGMNCTSVFTCAPRSDGFASMECNRQYITRPNGGATLLKEGPVFLSSIQSDGTVLWSLNPETLVQNRNNPVTGREEAHDFVGRSDARSLHYGANGTLYLVTEYSVAAISPEGEKLYETDERCTIESSVCTADGRVRVVYRKFPENRVYCAYIEDSIKGFADPIPVPDPDLGEYTLLLGEGYDFYFQTKDGLFAMNHGDTEPILFCRWTEAGIDYASLYQILVLSEDSFFYIGEKWRSGDLECGILRRVPEDEIQPKKIITLGDCSRIDYTRYVARFNRQSDEYYVVIRDYDAQKENGGATLEEDALAGNLPDIVSGWSSVLANKGVYVDLNTYLDADPAFRDDLLPAILEPFETQGKLYRLSSVFWLMGISGPASRVPAYEDWTLEAFLQLSEECKKDGTELMHSLYQSNLANILIYKNLTSFVDFENFTCDFTSELFADTLAYVQSLPPYQEYNATNDYSDDREQFFSGTMLLEPNSRIGDFRSFLTLKQQYGANGMTYLGNITSEGGMPTLNASISYSITADSPVKEGAWEFIRYMISEDPVQSTEANSALPVCRTALRALAEKEKHNYHVIDHNGRWALPLYWDGKNPPTEIDPRQQAAAWITEEDVEYLFDLLENRPLLTNASSTMESKIRPIVKEEVEAFLAGTSSAEETAKKIQSRVSLYLAEQS